MSLGGSKRSVQVNNVDIDLNDIDVRKLTHEQKRDLKEIERLQQEEEKMTLNWTMGNLSDIDNQYGMKNSILSSASQQRRIKQMEFEIKKYNKQMELLKTRMQHRQLIMNFKNMEKEKHLADPNF